MVSSPGQGGARGRAEGGERPAHRTKGAQAQRRPVPGVAKPPPRNRRRVGSHDRVEARSRRRGAPFPARAAWHPPAPPRAPRPALSQATRHADPRCSAELSFCPPATSALPVLAYRGAAGPGGRSGKSTEPSLPGAGTVSRSSAARTAPSLGTMGPRRLLLLVAAGLSLCGPQLSAGSQGREPGESCP